MLKSSCKICCLTSEFHTVGFTSEHNAKLLGLITHSGTVQGTFQYVKTSSDIAAAMSSLIDLIKFSQIAATLIFPNGSQNMSLQEVEGERKNDVVEYDSVNFIPSSIDISKVKISITTSNGNVLLSINSSEESNKTPKIFIEAITQYITRNILSLIDKIVDKSTTQNELKEITEKSKDMDLLINETIIHLRKLKRTEKKLLYPLCEDVTELMKKFHDLLSSAIKKTLTNEKIATLNNMAFKNIKKSGIKKALDKRIQNNVNLFDKIDINVEKAIKTIDFEKLKDFKLKYPVDKCFLTTEDWQNLLKDGDCLCITLDIARSETAIVDSSKVKVKKINQSFVSGESFLDSMIFSINTTGQ